MLCNRHENTFKQENEVLGTSVDGLQESDTARNKIVAEFYTDKEQLKAEVPALEGKLKNQMT